MNKYLYYLIVLLMVILVIPILLYIIIGVALTIISRLNPNQKLFSKGKLPNPNLNGAYRGSAFINLPWKGKSFFADKNSGINNFDFGDGVEQHFTFKTYSGKGLMDRETDFLKIDYDIPENHFYVRYILDELVEIEPGKYLGKAHLRFIPIIPFTIIYFRLEK